MVRPRLRRLTPALSVLREPGAHVRSSLAPAMLVVLAAFVAAPSEASAAGVDATHGRLDGDMAVVVGAGAVIGPRAPRAALDLRFRYLSTAGVFVTYEEGPLFGSAAEPRRVFATGLELRPLFLARWAQGLEVGEPRADLFIDSFALEIGAAFQQPIGRSFDQKPSLQAGLGLELPLFPRASGLLIGLHAGLRWNDAGLAGDVSTPRERASYLLVTIAWQQIFGAHVVDIFDRAR